LKVTDIINDKILCPAEEQENPDEVQYKYPLEVRQQFASLLWRLATSYSIMLISHRQEFKLTGTLTSSEVRTPIPRVSLSCR
jgi:hypothetical protein